MESDVDRRGMVAQIVVKSKQRAPRGDRSRAGDARVAGRATSRLRI